jgi:hypothetical protein
MSETGDGVDGVDGFDPLRLLRTLDAHEVRYVIIGGVAGALWGSPSATFDLDVC